MIENIISFLNNTNVNILVVHGLATSEHNHRYIHEAIYKTFKYIQKIYNREIEVYWIDDKKHNLYENTKDNFLIFSSPHYSTDNFLPILNHAHYILHYNQLNFVTKEKVTKYNNLLLSNKAMKYIEFRYCDTNKESINNTIFFYDKINNSFHMPWATNLLPYEIDVKIDSIKSLNKLPHTSKNSYFCGSIWTLNENKINEWKELCVKYNINPEFTKEKNEIIHQEKIRTAYIAPTIQGSSHIINEKKFYIPCRIFKNISYGNIGVTNNLGVYNLFKDFLIIYDDDLEKLIIKYINYIDSLDNPDNFKKYKEDMIKIMNHVKENHTYLSRLDAILNKLL